MASNFKIIAFKTGDCKKIDRGLRNPLKIIKPNKLYLFNTLYTFIEEDTNEILYDESKDIQFYISNNLPLNINAIVGNNGSGKSTLMELLFWANYNIGAYLNFFDSKKSKPYEFLDLEIIYQINSSLRKITFTKGEIYNETYKKRKNKFKIPADSKKNFSLDDLGSFFYTISINYSHYSLNSEEIGSWIDNLFHKNDGYQTPIVLNPMRTNGNFDINREKKLLQTRLIANLLEYVTVKNENNSLRSIFNGKTAKSIELIFDSINTSNLQEPKPLNLIIPHIEKHFDFKISEERRSEYRIYEIHLNYIYDKLVKISKVYKPFKRYSEKDGSIKYVNAYIEKVKNSNSHIVFKIKAAIIYLKYFDEIFNEKHKSKDGYLVDIDYLSNMVKKVGKNENFFVNTSMLTPVSKIFYSKIILDDNSNFDDFSSGEKQQIHSISSIIYHIINLNSVSNINEDDNITKYQFVNILLDEIELYYHPDWQRKFINNLTQYIGAINPQNIKDIKAINITFLTHSPFILSDIPKYNILYLDSKGMPIVNNNIRTFGANIHDLLKDSFFLNDGAVGEYAKNTINETICYLNLKRMERDGVTASEEYNDLKNNIRNLDPNYHLKIIQIIDEPLIRQKLFEMYDELFKTNNRLLYVREKIKELQEIETQLSKS